jgi:hypothetical protein
MDEVQNINREDNEKGTLSQKEKKRKGERKTQGKATTTLFFSLHRKIPSSMHD